MEETVGVGGCRRDGGLGGVKRQWEWGDVGDAETVG